MTSVRDGPGVPGHVPYRGEVPVLPGRQDLPDRGKVGCDHGRAHQQRLHHDVAQALHEGRQIRDVRGIHQPRHIGAIAQAMDAILDPERRDAGLERGVVGLDDLAARRADCELVAALLAREPLERVDVVV